MSKQKPEVYKERLIIAMEKHLGIVTTACKEVGISRETYYGYYNNDADFKLKIDALEEVTTDFVESRLLKKIKEGDRSSIIFYMKYKGRKRGYTDRLEIEGNIDIKGITTIELIEYKKRLDDNDKTEEE